MGVIYGVALFVVWMPRGAAGDQSQLISARKAAAHEQKAWSQRYRKGRWRQHRLGRTSPPARVGRPAHRRRPGDVSGRLGGRAGSSGLAGADTQDTARARRRWRRSGLDRNFDHPGGW